MQREHRILDRRGEAHSPTPPLYTIGEALCSRRGTPDSPNASLLGLAPISNLPPIPTLAQAPTIAIPPPISAVN